MALTTNIYDSIGGFGPSLPLIVLSAFLGLCAIAIFRWTTSASIPVINKYSGDLFLKKAHAEFLANCKKLISDGVAKYNGPFRVITTLGSRVILPAKFADWVKNCKDLDHVQLVADEYFAHYPGFDGNGVVVDPSRMMINVTKTKLNQNWRKSISISLSFARLISKCRS
jgi:hypothetical protein